MSVSRPGSCCGCGCRLGVAHTAAAVDTAITNADTTPPASSQPMTSSATIGASAVASAPTPATTAFQARPASATIRFILVVILTSCPFRLLEIEGPVDRGVGLGIPVVRESQRDRGVLHPSALLRDRDVHGPHAPDSVLGPVVGDPVRVGVVVI